MAQLEVDSLGNVGIQVSPSSTQTLYVKGTGHSIGVNMQSGDDMGIRLLNSNGGKGIYINNVNADDSGAYGVYIRPYGSHSTSMPTYGVSSLAGYSQTLNVGVWGGVKQGANNTTFYGAGVLGTTTNVGGIASAYMGLYAGYFRGDVRVVDGTLYGSVLTPSAMASNAVADLSGLSGSTRDGDDVESIADKLSQVSLLQFHREQEEETVCESKATNTISASLDNVDEAMTDEEEEKDVFVPQTRLASVQYGLAADQLREVFPELVYEDQNGNVSINYIEMIPLMLQYINELKAEVDELKGGGGDVAEKHISHKTKTPATSYDDIMLLSLGQNNPNPFSEQTSIEVSVPESVSAASLLIFDMQGKQVRKIDINDRGIFRITVTGQGLNEGMYLYSLIADGKVVQTRKMILSK